MWIQLGRQGVRSPSEKNKKNMGFLSSICPDLLKKYICVKPAFNAGPSSACHFNGISLVAAWWYLDPLSPHQAKTTTTKKNNQSWTTSDKTFWILTWVIIQVEGPAGPIAQLITNLIADPEVVSSILDRSHTLVEIDHEISSMFILLLLLLQEGLVSVSS